MRPTLPLLLGLVLAGLAASPASAQPDAERPPNLVLILADDLGYGDTSPYGGWIDTPHLDRLAREGLRFTDFYASGPVFSPTRAGLLTGRYQQRAGIPGVVYAAPDRNRHHGLHPHEITLAERLRAAGYATGAFGKWHLGYAPRYNPVHHGFDEFRGYVSGNVDYVSHVDQAGFYDWWDGDRLVNERGYVTHLITEHAVDFIERHRDRPFLLYLPHEAPHYPYQGPDDPAFRIVNQPVREVRDSAQVRRAYREMVGELDAGVGAVLDALERLDLDDNTLVVFLSDNGANRFGSNGALRGRKGSLWEGGIRVPALARWPGRIAPGRTADMPALSIDWMPTFLALADAALPTGHRLDGVDLGPVLFEARDLAPRPLFWAYNDQTAARDGRWKLVRDLSGEPGPALYDLAADPAETTDLAAREPERVRRMTAALDAWQADVARGATVQPEPAAADAVFAPPSDRPNVVLVMTDDLGWGDVGFNGSTFVRTPRLDRLAASGLTFRRFYAASAVCSPTRASALTGRHPMRQGVPTANAGHLRDEEVTLAEHLRDAGYATGFFGKWHLGTLTTRIRDSNRGRPGDSTHFSLPTRHGFDTYFATEAKVPTYDPMLRPARFDTSRGESLHYGWAAVGETQATEPYGTHYWTGPDAPVADGLDGDDSDLIVDRALGFIDGAINDDRPFFAVVWLHAPHLPVVADSAARAAYAGRSHVEQLYGGTISALDDAVGRLWDHLEARGAARRTMLWFASDNGPERGTPGSAGPFRERKRSLYEGGVRVPAFLVWPERVGPGRATDVPAVTSDYLPTVLDALGLGVPADRPLDGVSLTDVIAGDREVRGVPIGFRFRERMSWVDDRYKLISTDDGQTFELYDLIQDPEEQRDLAAREPERAGAMQSALREWLASCARSAAGEDY